MNLETAYANVVKMDEAVKYAAVCEVITERSRGSSDDVDMDANAYPSANVEKG